MSRAGGESEAQFSSHRGAIPPPPPFQAQTAQPQSQDEVLSHLPFTFGYIANSSAASTIRLIRPQCIRHQLLTMAVAPIQGATPANIDNLFTARGPFSVATIFMTLSEVEAVMKTEKEKASSSSTSLELKPPQLVQVVVKGVILQSTKCLSSRNSMTIKATPGSMLCVSLTLQAPLSLLDAKSDQQPPFSRLGLYGICLP